MFLLALLATGSGSSIGRGASGPRSQKVFVLASPIALSIVRDGWDPHSLMGFFLDFYVFMLIFNHISIDFS